MRTYLIKGHVNTWMLYWRTCTTGLYILHKDMSNNMMYFTAYVLLDCMSYRVFFAKGYIRIFLIGGHVEHVLPVEISYKICLMEGYALQKYFCMRIPLMGGHVLLAKNLVYIYIYIYIYNQKHRNHKSKNYFLTETSQVNLRSYLDSVHVDVHEPRNL